MHELVHDDAGYFGGVPRSGDVGDVSQGEVDFFVVGVELCAGCVGYAVHVPQDQGYGAGWWGVEW